MTKLVLDLEMDKMTILKTESNLLGQNEKSQT